MGQSLRASSFVGSLGPRDWPHGRLDLVRQLAVGVEVIATDDNIQFYLSESHGGRQIDLSFPKHCARRPGGAFCFVNR
jgi:hypothetical protein